ncbi:MAG: glutamine--fructose-6-phosphate transaminase (isomerizing), partial [Alistipes onderdonkii]|nr:glutamine--fructose-6-phosphate transaminase (isomerizing) [Alistipes onderdonkii]
MCGIVGYVGGREACPVLLKGLHRLEYRGYDSAGVAMVGKDGALNVYKCKGKVSDLEHFLEGKELGGSIGIAHTRWATHGVPNDVNAHPHYSESENIALIHNGIIENYRVLKDALEENGYTFRSSTDSEVLVNLIEYIRTTGGCTLLEAVQQALRQVVGAYAIAVIEKGNRDEIIAARQSSPMAIGIGEGEFFLSSDAASVIEYTQDFVYVNDGEIAVINRHKPLKIVTLDNHEGRVDIKKLQMSISQLEKGGYPHFMLKEIYEQPKTIVDCIRGRISPDTYEVKLSGVIDNRGKFLAARRIVFVACGTSWHAALIGEHLIENICRIPVEVEYASEFRYRNPIINADDIVIAVSQSGETADTLAAVELARKAGAFVFGICNVVGSSIARATDSGAYIHVGPEIGVASTKAFTGQVTVMAMLALAVGREKGTVTEEYYREVAKGLLELPAVLEDVLPPIFAKFGTYDVASAAPFRRIPYNTALETYGSDKPDLRIDLTCKNVSRLFENSEFEPLRGQTVKMVDISDCTLTRKQVEKLLSDCEVQSGSKAYWFKVDEKGELAGGIAKFVTGLRPQLEQVLTLAPNTLVVVAAGASATKSAGVLIKTFGAACAGHMDQERCEFCWIVDFPMYEIGDESGELEFCHNPFSMPSGGLEVLLKAERGEIDPLTITADQYDLVCNGVELSSGAVRNHDPEIMVKA